MINKDKFTEFYIKTIYDSISDEARSGNYEKIDQSLERIEVDFSPTSLMLAYLDVTKPYKNELKNREKFYDRVNKIIKRRRDLEDLILLKTLK